MWVYYNIGRMKNNDMIDAVVAHGAGRCGGNGQARGIDVVEVRIVAAVPDQQGIGSPLDFGMGIRILGRGDAIHGKLHGNRVREARDLYQIERERRPVLLELPGGEKDIDRIMLRAGADVVLVNMIVEAAPCDVFLIITSAHCPEYEDNKQYGYTYPHDPIPLPRLRRRIDISPASLLRVMDFQGITILRISYDTAGDMSTSARSAAVSATARSRLCLIIILWVAIIRPKKNHTK